MIEYDKYGFKSKGKPKYVKENENTYCFVCKKKTNNSSSRKDKA